MDNNDIKDLIAGYRQATNSLLLLDYDGTLVNYELKPEDARLPEHLNDILKRLIAKPGTTVFIISGRARNDIERMLHHLQVNIISEHGAMIKNGGVWKNLTSGNCQWKDSVFPILGQAASDCPGSYIEEKNCSVAWHYRNADSQDGFSHSRKLIRILEKIVHSLNLKILDGNKVVELIPGDTGKGRVVKMLTDQAKYDFILAIGDDKTDEEMFECLSDNPESFTIRVGSGESHAKYGFESINDVISLLKRLSV